ncbi:hypothetical protein KIW84_075218 [Lathyrus oleraceus]|uniref:Uncharacterized protein n=1 Tax=Pisum sativum TaxID=3888 RepID=A0A9D5A1M5_PEA|nr:hypothetical protein KIW84_075218 [Pisum sativum]
MNSEPHREALQKVLDMAYVEHDVTIEQFDSIVANITTCNNLSFCDADLPEEGRNHNLALHISMNYKDDVMSNVLVDTRSSLNVLPKSTLARLSYQGPPMRQSGVVVKAFDGSRKTVIGEVELPVKIGPSDFQITFQMEDYKSRAGIGYSSGTFNKHGLFQSGGFIHATEDEEAAAIVEEDAEEDSGNFIIPGGVCNN